jgi:hypothetical protein
MIHSSMRLSRPVSIHEVRVRRNLPAVRLKLMEFAYDNPYALLNVHSRVPIWSWKSCRIARLVMKLEPRPKAGLIFCSGVAQDRMQS